MDGISVLKTHSLIEQMTQTQPMETQEICISPASGEDGSGKAFLRIWILTCVLTHNQNWVAGGGGDKGQEREREGMVGTLAIVLLSILIGY